MIAHQHHAYVIFFGNALLIDGWRIGQDFIVWQLIGPQLKSFRNGNRHLAFLLPHMRGKAFADGAGIFARKKLSHRCRIVGHQGGRRLEAALARQAHLHGLLDHNPGSGILIDAPHRQGLKEIGDGVIEAAVFK